MNFLYISPDFPLNYRLFPLNLAHLGVQVYGVGETPFFDLPEDLRGALRWYEQVELKDTEAVIDAVSGMFHQVPDLRAFDVAESHNEYWLDLEAALNTHFTIPGMGVDRMPQWKRKSLMKETFSSAGIPVARGGLVPTVDDAVALAGRLGYPVILKPDCGVGGNGVHKIQDEAALREVFPTLTEPYLMEEFIEGGIITFDGLTNHDGEIIYSSSLTLSHGILDYLRGADIAFYSTREIPEELRKLGTLIASIFDIRRKFFHFEFFRRGDTYIPIEINARPPGGPILDLMNHALESDLYYHYAAMIRDNRAAIPETKRWFVAYLSRKSDDYALSHAELLERHRPALVEYTENHPLYWEAMGRHRYLFRAATEEELLGIMEDVLRRV